MTLLKKKYKIEQKETLKEKENTIIKHSKLSQKGDEYRENLRKRKNSSILTPEYIKCFDFSIHHSLPI